MKIITVKMLDDQTGSPDGISVIDYKDDHVYNLPEPLALAFVHDLDVAIIYDDDDDDDDDEPSSEFESD